MSSELPIKFGAAFPAGITQAGSSSTARSLFVIRFSAATANIPSPRLRAEKAPVERSRLFPCCNLTRKTKRTRPCSDCPTSSLHMILRVAKTGCLITLDRPERNQPQAEYTNVSHLQLQYALQFLRGSWRDSAPLGAVAKAASNRASTRPPVGT